MKSLVVNDKMRIADWVAEHIAGATKWVGNYQALGISKDGKLVAGAVIDSYSPQASCSLHCAGVGTHWLTRSFLQSVFQYIFVQLECNVVINTVCSANTAAQRFTEHIGFTEVCRIAGGYSDGDLIIYVLRRENCRWIGD